MKFSVSASEEMAKIPPEDLKLLCTILDNQFRHVHEGGLIGKLSPAGREWLIACEIKLISKKGKQ